MKNICGTSEYIGFIDECGDHSMVKIDKDFPIFVLCLTVVSRIDYVHTIIPKMSELKLKYWSHEGINLHSRDIRKEKGSFSFLQIHEKRNMFLCDLNEFVEKSPFTIFVVCINKKKHLDRYGSNAQNPYEFALKMCMERVIHFLGEKNVSTFPIIAESRGKREDSDLEKAFYEIMTCGTRYISAEKFKSLACPLAFWDKRANIAGLQLADLAAYPCARHILKPDQENRAFNILENKIYRDGTLRGWKMFP